MSCLNQLMMVPRESRGLDFGNIGGSALLTVENSPLVAHRYLPRADGALVDLLGSEAGGFVGRVTRLLDGRTVIVTPQGLLTWEGGKWRQVRAPLALLTPQHDLLAVTSSGVAAALHRKLDFGQELVLRGGGVDRTIRNVVAWTAVAGGRAIDLHTSAAASGGETRPLRVTLEPSVAVQDPSPEAPREPEARLVRDDALVPVVVGSERRRWVEVRTPEGEVRRRVFAPCASGACVPYAGIVELSKDGNHLLVTSGPDILTHFALDTGTISELRVPGARIRSAAFAADDTRVITTSSDGYVRLWYLDAHEAVQAARARRIGALTEEDQALLRGLFPDAPAPTPTQEERQRWPSATAPAPAAPPPGDRSGPACGGAAGCGG